MLPKNCAYSCHKNEIPSEFYISQEYCVVRVVNLRKQVDVDKTYMGQESQKKDYEVTPRDINNKIDGRKEKAALQADNVSRQVSLSEAGLT